MTVPIVFIRQWTAVGGYFYGVPIAINCARKWNPDGRVIFIGDDKQPAEVKALTEFHRVEDFSRFKRELARVWPFGGRPDEWFLKSTLENWLILADWMNQTGTEFVCCLDTDVLLFADVTKECQHWRQFDISWCNPLGTNQAPTFVSRSAMVEFAGWLLAMYQKTMNVTNACFEESKCCMSSFRWWSIMRPDLKIGNLCDVIEGATWDHNLAMSYGSYDHDGIGKVTVFKNGQPYWNRNGESVRVRALHMWGHYKSKLLEFVKRSEDSM